MTVSDTHAIDLLTEAISYAPSPLRQQAADSLDNLLSFQSQGVQPFGDDRLPSGATARPNSDPGRSVVPERSDGLLRVTAADGSDTHADTLDVDYVHEAESARSLAATILWSSWFLVGKLPLCRVRCHDWCGCCSPGVCVRCGREDWWT